MIAHVERSHAIRLGYPVERVFPLFTPAGEEDWVEGWRPEYLSPAGRETREGMVFRTGADDETTFWSCVLWRPDRHHARYVRVTPASRFGFVDVSCRALADGGAEATVSYAITALNARGRD